MKEHLTLTYVKRPYGHFLAQITHQTFRSTEFNKTSSGFHASCGVELFSSCNPELIDNRDDGGILTLFVRGNDSDYDNIHFIIPDREALDRIKLAVWEYNQELRSWNPTWP